MDGFSADIKDEQYKKLKELFPEVFSEGKIDWDKLRATLGEHIDFSERYGLSWKGKSGVFAKIQEKTVSTLHPQREESVDWDATGNMFIEGDNLETLKVLHKAYYGKVKMIYIDPPYNTGNDFIYSDSFKQSRRDYEEEAGLVDEEGNTTRDDGMRVNSGGNKHSNWLNMIYPRLWLAKNLLRQDGVIFISIDGNEVHNLHLIMNEIFGEENFVGIYVKQSKVGGGSDSRHIVQEHEYCVVYAKSVNDLPDMYIEHSPDYLKRYKEKDEKGRYFWDTFARPGLKNPIYYDIALPDGTAVNKGWIWSKDRFERGIKSGEVVIRQTTKGSWGVYFKQRLNESGKKPRSLTMDFGGTAQGKIDTGSLFDNVSMFEYPKSVKYIKELIRTIGDKEAVILDFFSGSGTLAHAVMELNAEDDGNRKWICVQLPELTDKKSEAYRAGYKTIAEIARERIRRAAKKIAEGYKDKIAERETPLYLGFRSYVLGDSNFKKWNELVRDPEEIRQQTLEQIDPIEPGASDEDLLTEILLKHGISPLAKLEQHDGFIYVPSDNLAISLTHNMTKELFKSMLAKNPSQIIVLDMAFSDDLNLKTNLSLQAEQRNIILEVL